MKDFAFQTNIQKYSNLNFSKIKTTSKVFQFEKLKVFQDTLLFALRNEKLETLCYLRNENEKRMESSKSVFFPYDLDHLYPLSTGRQNLNTRV